MSTAEARRRLIQAWRAYDATRLELEQLEQIYYQAAAEYDRAVTMERGEEHEQESSVG